MSKAWDEPGYTLFELVITMAIIAILAAIGIPSFQYVTASNRMSGEVNSLLGDMQYARNEAIKEGQWVTVCASALPSSPAPTCSGSAAWQTGWIVFSDPNNNQQVDANEPILRVQGAFTGTDTFVADNAAAAVTFNREGFAASGPLNATVLTHTVTITLHDSSNTSQWTRCLAVTSAFSPTAINTTGMLATEKAGVGNCS
jgi:type IV fimbrial biogenesis protein FimT